MIANANGDYGALSYVLERDAVVRANAGCGRISIAWLMPSAFSGLQSPISTVVQGLPSPPRFLLYLFGELAIGRERTLSPVISLDGFLGSAFCHQSPWLLLVLAGIWTTSSATVPRSVELLAESCRYWSAGRELDFNQRLCLNRTTFGDSCLVARSQTDAWWNCS